MLVVGHCRLGAKIRELQAKGNVALFSANALVRATAPGMLATQ
jgi:hypothetical protein